MIQIRALDQNTFEVTVPGAVATTHTVTVDPSYHRKLTGGSASPRNLVERSFEYLLEREPNTSILRRFDLSVISQYFGDYERTIRQMLEES